ncbi:hypothetical protein [Streptomyces sp. TBY4]|uniref:hypothetical protein n=1 Tax=Streptomyces sp. TBY4 TaxID=2962030 RepID=UPI0020B80455|nr:hypothetical protein [Streptomyces sp. TBY4]MCP3756031.1 hypothetical protein [Streptomyces sp. TBY4]
MATTKRALTNRGASESGVPRHGGRVERGITDALRASRAGERPDPRWAAVEALARTLGRALDGAAAGGEVYAVVQLSGRLLGVLRELGLTPASTTGTAEDDALAALLADLSVPTYTT